MSGHSEIVALLRSWGREVRVQGGAYGRSNGLKWQVPTNRLRLANHHFVCRQTRDHEYNQKMVDMLVAGRTVNWAGDSNGIIYLIGDGPMNHAGWGDEAAYQAIMSGTEIPWQRSGPYNNRAGNAIQDGVEWLHPGDSTPWDPQMLDAMWDLNAAVHIVRGTLPHNHFEWASKRKIDMSLLKGPAGMSASGTYLRTQTLERAKARQEPKPAPKPTPTPEHTPIPNIEPKDEDMLQLLAIVEDADTRKRYTWNANLGRLTHVKDEAQLKLLVRSGYLRTDSKGSPVVTTMYWGEVRDVMIGCGLSNAETATQFDRAGFKSKAQASAAKK